MMPFSCISSYNWRHLCESRFSVWPTALTSDVYVKWSGTTPCCFIWSKTWKASFVKPMCVWEREHKTDQQLATIQQTTKVGLAERMKVMRERERERENNHCGPSIRSCQCTWSCWDEATNPWACSTYFGPRPACSRDSWHGWRQWEWPESVWCAFRD